jgi:AcrR family transcriptional regulator
MSASSRLPAGSGARQARAERILDSAGELLRRHGYKRVTIDDVARAAGIGKGTIYLHWKTREALFWAVLQRDAARMITDVLADLAADPALALPSQLMRAIFLGVSRRPLVQALLLSDVEVLGDLASDETVSAGQRELAGSENYLEILAELGLLRPGLTVEAAGHILASVMRGFYQAEPDAGAGLPLGAQADLLADVLHRSLEADGEPPPRALAALSTRVTALLSRIVEVQRSQLERAY